MTFWYAAYNLHTLSAVSDAGRCVALSGPMTDTDWDEVSFVISSHHRIEILRRLAAGPTTPSEIATDASLSLSHVSRALTQLRTRSLVTLKVSEDRSKGRVYGLTDTGEQVWTLIEEENMV